MGPLRVLQLLGKPFALRVHGCAIGPLRAGASRARRRWRRWLGGPLDGRLPELGPVGAVVRLEEKRAIDVSEVGREAGRAWVDPAAGDGVLDHHRPCWGAVALPELAAVGAVVRREEEVAVDGGEAIRVGAERARGDPASGNGVLDHHRPCWGAVALPELAAVSAVVRREEERAV